MAEVKHMRVVMSLCKLKLYQYHDILAASIDDDDVKAQHALTGIQEVFTCNFYLHFSIVEDYSTIDISLALYSTRDRPFFDEIVAQRRRGWRSESRNFRIWRRRNVVHKRRIFAARYRRCGQYVLATA